MLPPGGILLTAVFGKWLLQRFQDGIYMKTEANTEVLEAAGIRPVKN